MADWLDSQHGSSVSEKSIFAALSQYWEEQFHTDMDSLNVSSAVLQESLSPWFPTRSDTNRAVQPQKMARGLKFQI